MRGSAFTMLLMLVVASCGGIDATGIDPEGSGSGDDAPSSGSAAHEDSSGQAGEGGGNGATVIIGDTRFEFGLDPAHTCNSFDKIIGGSFAIDSDGNATQPGGGSQSGGAQLNFAIPVPTWETEGLQPPSIIIDHWGEEIRWMAQGDMDLGAVEDWELSDGVATGTASFIAQGGTTGSDAAGQPDEEPVLGSFEITCIGQ